MHMCMYRYRREQVLQHVFGCLGLLMELCGLLTGAGRLLCVHVSIQSTWTWSKRIRRARAADSWLHMDDIEDMLIDPEAVRRPAVGVSRRTAKKAAVDIPAASDAESFSSTPGSQAVYVKTYGCSHNSSDSEYMAGLLQQYGYRLVDEKDREQADLWLINSCTVKNPSEEHMVTDLKKGHALGKALVVAGCVSQAQPELGPLADLSLVGVQQIDRVVEVVQETLKGNTMRVLSKKVRPSLDLPKVRRNPLIEIIPVNTGCLGSCTYCKTVYARGTLGSYDPGALRARLEAAFDEGVVEVWLTSEDTGAYGRDIGSSMPALMRTLLDAVPEGRMLRVGMTNPPYMLEHIDDIAELLNHPRCYAFLHVPVQSGSDAVLTGVGRDGRGMNREYTRADFDRVADVLMSKVPDLTLATDVICGFPGETEADHDATLQMISKYKFPVLNISQFYPRQGTPAAKMPRVPTHLVKARTREASLLFKSYRTLDRLAGTEQTVLVTEIAHDGTSLVGHTKGYVQVILPHVPAHMGCTLRVKVVEVGKFFVTAEVLAVLHKPPRASVAERVVAKSTKDKTAPTAEDLRAILPTGDCGGGGCNEADCCSKPKEQMACDANEPARGKACSGDCDCAEPARAPLPSAAEAGGGPQSPLTAGAAGAAVAPMTDAGGGSMEPEVALDDVNAARAEAALAQEQAASALVLRRARLASIAAAVVVAVVVLRSRNWR